MPPIFGNKAPNRKILFRCAEKSSEKDAAVDRLTELELFVHTAELNSMSKAAEALGLSNPAATRHLASLERRLGARLIERNTRRLFLTDVGQDFYRRCKGILSDVSEAEQTVDATRLNPGGVLRVTASLPFCMKHIAPLLPAFTQRYPNLRVQLIAANRYFDIIDNNVDVAIRTREYESDSGVTIRRLAEMRRVLTASPRYLDSRGTPASVEDLAQHDLLVYSYANHPDELRFTKGDSMVTMRALGLLEANDPQVLRAAALEGLGILVLPMYIVHDDIVAGRLVPILTDWHLPKLTISIAYASRQHLPAKSRVFIDFLVEHFRQMDYERRWNA